jgi:hypothetical protein
MLNFFCKINEMKIICDHDGAKNVLFSTFIKKFIFESLKKNIFDIKIAQTHIIHLSLGN